MMDTLRALVEEGDNVCDQMSNFSREMEITKESKEIVEIKNT